MKFVAIMWLVCFVTGCIICRNSTFDFTIKTQKNQNKQSANLEGLDEYTRTYTFLGGKR